MTNFTLMLIDAREEKNIKPFYFDFLLHTHRFLVLSCTKFCVCLHFPRYISPPSKCNKLLCWHDCSVLIRLHTAPSCPHCVTIFSLSFSSSSSTILSQQCMLYQFLLCFLSFFSLLRGHIVQHMIFIFRYVWHSAHRISCTYLLCIANEVGWGNT